jgi:BspA type Leucine rich repeat region (6 copies)
MNTSQITRAAKFLLILLFLSPLVMAQAQYTFSTNSDGSLNIEQYTGPGGAIVIPNTTNGLPITSIGNLAFFNISTLAGVMVGTNVGSIGDQAFSDSSVTSIALSASVTNISFNSFQTCFSLTNIVVATNNPDFSSLAGVLFDQNQTTLLQYPNGKAGSYAVPASVTDIGVDAFFESTSLTSVDLSSNVSIISDYAFWVCPAVTNFIVATNNLWFSSVAGVLFDKNQDVVIAYPPGNAATSYVMPNTVTYIGMDAFYGAANLINVTLGTNVSIIGPFAFGDCYALAGISFPNSVTVISGVAFSECSSLANIAIGTGITNIQYQAFVGCSGITTITVAAGNPAFVSVNNVLFSSNLTTLVQYPTANSATSYTIPNSVTNVTAFAFMEAYNLASITLDTNLQSIGDSAFQQCISLTSITIPNSVTNLGFSVFYDDFELTNAVIGSGLTSIGFGVFDNCYNMPGLYFMGNAPAMNSDVFDGDNTTIAYYLPGTTGWSTNFDGLPTAVWLPQIVSSAVQTNQFSFSVDWASGQTVVLEGCTNLLHPVWSPLQTNLLSSSSWYFSDPHWTNYPRRFYRAVSP